MSNQNLPAGMSERGIQVSPAFLLSYSWAKLPSTWHWDILINTWGNHQVWKFSWGRKVALVLPLHPCLPIPELLEWDKQQPFAGHWDQSLPYWHRFSWKSTQNCPDRKSPYAYFSMVPIFFKMGSNRGHEYLYRWTSLLSFILNLSTSFQQDSVIGTEGTKRNHIWSVLSRSSYLTDSQRIYKHIP